MATRTIRSIGLPRYTAVNLLLGMAWLAVAGITWLTLGPQPDGPGYDLVVHAIGLGFAMSMVLAHAPIILPAVLIRPLPYRPVLYVATVALQVSLLVRVAADVREAGWAWQAAGPATSSRSCLRRHRRRPGGPAMTRSAGTSAPRRSCWLG